MLSVPILDNPAWSTVHQLNFADPCEDFVAPVAHALVRAASTLVSTLGGIPPRLRPCCFVWQLLQFFAGRDDSAATPAPEGRHIIAQCVSTGKGMRDRRAPERGGRGGDESFFRPVPGLCALG